MPNDADNPRDPQALAARLFTHVDRLAGLIGPRYPGKPAALAAAATYVERQLGEQGEQVVREAYSLGGADNLEVANFYIERRGTKRSADRTTVRSGIKAIPPR